MQIYSTNNINFNGIKVSNIKVSAKNISEEYSLYKVTKRDKEFLEKLYTSINLPRLYDNLTEYQYDAWDWVLKQGLTKKISKNTNAFLLADKNNNPCGIIKYTQSSNKSNLKYLCTWPGNRNERKPFAGKALIVAMFKQLVKNPKCEEEVHALKLSAFNPVKKYQEMGFNKEVADKIMIKILTISHSGMVKTINKFKNIIQITNKNSGKDVNLFDILKIPNNN